MGLILNQLSSFQLDRDKALIELCLQIAYGNIGGSRFNQLLVETGIYLDDFEWEQANRLLGKSEQMFSLVEPRDSLC